MSQAVLKTTTREAGLSRGQLMKARAQGSIPAVYFGAGIDSQSCFVNEIEFRKMYNAKGKIFEIDLGGQTKLVNTKKIDFDFMNKDILHSNFYALKKGVETTVKVPVNTTGTAKGEKEGGTVQVLQATIEVTGTPMNIPEEILIDVTELGVGENLTVAQISVGGKYTFKTDGETAVVTCLAPQKAEAEAAPAEGEEGAAEGVAPAADAAPAEGAEESKE